MAKKKSLTQIHDRPTQIYIEGQVYYFDVVAPITGDSIYRHESSTGSVSHAIITNPDARSHQLQHLHRGI